MIRSMHSLRRLGSVAKDMQNLTLANNDIKQMAEVHHIRGAQRSLVRLVLQANPATAKFTDTYGDAAKRMQYEKEVRKVFPDLKELDGVAIASSMPMQPQPNHVPAQFSAVVGAFVTKYLGALNEPNRPNLKFAFFERSMFSLTAMMGGS